VVADPVFDPENRELYTTLVRPPDGYRFDHAVATTYSLDFETALAIPIAIVFRDAENRADMLRNPLALLQSVERMAGRMAIYCDRGRIKEAGPDAARLMALYESTITEVSAPGKGAFHPKLWCIRFQPEKTGEPVRMRLAILSRNLTDDRSWDLALCLDGQVWPDDDPNDVNDPVVRLLRALPGLANSATRPVAPKFLPSLLRDLAHCRWDKLPAGANKLSFAVNGLERGAWAPPKGERLAIVSPFVSADALKMLSAGYDDPSLCQLVARPEALDRLTPNARKPFQIQTLDDRVAEDEAGERDEPSPTDMEGLHAKAYLVERGSRLQIHLGSANATAAALIAVSGGRTQNVEIMATLDGLKTKMGTIDDVLFCDGFQRLLAPYTPSEQVEQDAAIAAEKMLDKVRMQIAALPLQIQCNQLDDTIALEVRLAGQPVPVKFPEGASCFVRAITILNERGQDAIGLFSGAEAGIQLGEVPLRDVTRWICVRLRDEATGVECRFTLGARLIDLPEGRDAAVLRALIDNAQNFLRYLSLLLGSLGEGSFLESDNAGAGQWLRRLGHGGNSLLEPMIRALSLGGDELLEIDRLLKRLQDPADGPNVVPPEFLELWKSFEPLVSPKRDKN
jgi:hypothetical protein